eukprot:s4041_g1.t1
MEFLDPLPDSSLSTGKFCELVICESMDERHHLADFAGQKVIIQWVNGFAPTLPIGTKISIWDFEFDHDNANEIATVKVDFGSHTRWVVAVPREKEIQLNGRFIELCAGLGGWSCGLGHMKMNTRLLIDKDVNVATACSKWLNLPLFSLSEAYDMAAAGKTVPSCVIIADIFDKRLWTVIGLIGPDFGLVSAPSNPWSRGGSGSGLSSIDGKLMAFIPEMAQKTGIRCLVAENVAEIASHSHYKAIEYSAKRCGMPIRFTSIDDSFPLIPVRRDRWLATFLTAEIQIPMYILEWVSKVNFPKVHPKDSNIGARDCILLDLSDEQRQELVLDPAAMAKLSNFKYLPHWLRKDGKTALESRTLGPHDILSGLMAMHGYQHLIADDLLLDKGLFTALIQDRESVRYISPFEWMAALGWPCSLHLPKEIEAAWNAAGNSTSIPHVILALFKTHACLQDRSPWGTKIFNLRELMNIALEDRIQVSKVKQVCGESTRWLQIDDVHSEVVQVDSFSSPVCDLFHLGDVGGVGVCPVAESMSGTSAIGPQGLHPKASVKPEDGHAPPHGGVPIRHAEALQGASAVGVPIRHAEALQGASAV